MEKLSGSELVTDGSEQQFALSDVVLSLDASRWEAVNHADNAAAEFGLGDDDLNRVGGGAEDTAHLWDLLDAVEDVDRVAIVDEHDEGVSGCDRLHAADGEVDEVGIVTGPADEARTGGLGEGNAESQVGAGADQRFVEVLHRLDEMCLADDHIHAVWLVDRHRGDVHGRLTLRPAPPS